MTNKPRLPDDIFASTTRPEPPQPAPVESPAERAAVSARPARKPATTTGAWKATQVRFDPATAETLARLTELARRKGRPAVSNSALLRFALAKLVEEMSDKEIVANCPVPTRVTIVQ